MINQRREKLLEKEQSTKLKNDQLKYNVFTPSRGYDDNDPWGAGTTEDFFTNGKPQVLSILGKVYGNQYIKPDNYTDSLRVVVSY